MTNDEFEQLVNQTKPAVLAAIGRTLPASLSAHIDDVVQTTYLNAFRYLKNTQSIAAASNYLYTIAKHESFKVIKRELKESNLDLTPEEQNQSELRELLDNIPSKYGRVLRLFVDGYSLKEIATQFNVSVGTIKSRIYRGKQLAKRKAGEGQ